MHPPLLLPVTRSEARGTTGGGGSLFGAAQQPAQLQKRTDLKDTDGYVTSRSSRALNRPGDWKPDANIVISKESCGNHWQFRAAGKDDGHLEPVEHRQSRT